MKPYDRAPSSVKYRPHVSCTLYQDASWYTDTISWNFSCPEGQSWSSTVKGSWKSIACCFVFIHMFLSSKYIKQRKSIKWRVQLQFIAHLHFYITSLWCSTVYQYWKKSLQERFIQDWYTVQDACEHSNWKTVGANFFQYQYTVLVYRISIQYRMHVNATYLELS